MSATNSSAAVARSQAKRRRSVLDSLKRVLPERSAKLTAGLTIVIAMVLFAIIVPIFTKDPNKINDIGLSAPLFRSPHGLAVPVYCGRKHCLCVGVIMFLPQKLQVNVRGA